MSARRYSGHLAILVSYLDSRAADTFADGTPRHPNGSYRCSIRNLTPGITDRVRVVVGAPACLSSAVDSPEAFDGAASAAVAFADHENGSIGESAAYDDSGVHVGRDPADAWPVLGYDGSTLTKGTRIELHPGCDLWMQGARYGAITSIRGGVVTVALDKRRKHLRTSGVHVRAIPTTHTAEATPHATEGSRS